MKKSSLKKSVTIFICFSMTVILGAWGYIFFELNKVKTGELSKTNEDLGIKNPLNKSNSLREAESSEIVNIALFGVDRRHKEDATRSDAIIIATIDKKHNKIKLSSIMRDTYVNVPGHGMTKVTHAYAYGGPQLAIKTLNSNFDLDIKDYVTVDFYSLEKIIDQLGGVSIDVKQGEIPLINKQMEELSVIDGEQVIPVSSAGTQVLNGRQAVSYSRIRYYGNGDYERTDRQRKVLSALFDKIQSKGVMSLASIVPAVLSEAETSLSKVEILKLATSIVSSQTPAIEQNRFPLDKDSSGKILKDGGWYLVTDLKVTASKIHSFIYEESADSSSNKSN